MKRARRTRAAVVVGAASILACAGESGGPAELRFEADGPPRTYLASYEQDVEWGAAAIERQYGARLTLSASGSPADATARMRARLDSLGVAITIHGGVQSFDTRHLAGAEFEMLIPPGGGPPTYFGEIPQLEIGMLEGRVTLDRLLDFGFPDLPSGPAAVGERWTAEWTLPIVEANVAATTTITVDYELAGWDTIDGVECARIEGRLSGDTSAAGPGHGGGSSDYAGTLAGSLTWHFDPGSGAIVRMSGETASDGTLTVSGNESRIRQATRLGLQVDR